MSLKFKTIEEKKIIFNQLKDPPAYFNSSSELEKNQEKINKSWFESIYLW
jgi:hypothetical protein